MRACPERANGTVLTAEVDNTGCIKTAESKTSEKMLVKTCRLKAVPVGILRSSPIPRNGMGFPGAYRVREMGGLFWCPRFDEFRGQNPIEVCVSSQPDVVSCRRIAVFESNRGDGAFPVSFCGVSAPSECVGKGKNGTKSWNDGETGDIISSTDRECGRTRIHRGNVGLVDLNCS